MPEIKPMLPPKLPEPMAGSVWHCMSPVGQLGDNVCFVYFKNYVAYLWLNGVSYLLPDSPVYHPYPYKVILTNYIWLIEQSDGIKVHQYQVIDGEVNLISTVILGDSNSIWGDVILLQSGKLVIAWWQKPGVDITDIEIRFALGNEAGWSEINTIMPGSHLRQNKIALAQHPADNSIWYFQTSDSRGVLKAMSLVENGDNLKVTLTEPYFIPYQNELRPEGEMPTVRAMPDAATQSILVAYQNKDYYFFSSAIPICKGANINVISVKSDGAISLRGVLERWVERISNFSIGIASGQFWLAFGEIDAETLKWNILKVYYEDGSEKYLGLLKAMGSSQGGLYMTNSTEWVIGTMEDDMIHFYRRQLQTPGEIVEWDAEIKQHSLHLKYDSQLFFLEESIENKIPRVNRDLMEILFFPDAKKKEICQTYIDSGEVTNYFDMETPVPILLKDKEKIDAEYSHKVDFYTRKLSWLKEKLTCCKKEMELRADGLVERIPKGTPYFVDFDNGHDVDNDGTTKTKINGDGPWATCDKATSVLIAGDVCTARRGMTQAVSQDLAFANDGTIVAPCTLTADYSDTWGDDTVATETATLTFGSKVVTFAGDISGDIAAHDWIYESTEVASNWAYEVESVSGGSNEIVTLFLPYKGAISGAGKTINIMPDNPIWNTAAGNYQVYPNTDDYWKLQGLHLRGTDVNGALYVYNCHCFLGKDLILEGNGVDDTGVRVFAKGATFLKTRCYNYAKGIYPSAGGVIAKDCLLDGNSVTGSFGLNLTTQYEFNHKMYDCEFKNHVTGDVRVVDGVGMVGRNLLLSSTTEIYGHSSSINSEAKIEDFDQTLGDNRQLTGFSTADGTPSIQSDTTDVRSGGGATSIKVTPSTNLSTTWEQSRIQLFEYPIYAVKDVEKTYTVYFKSDDDTDWDADPLATELWIEAEYWGHATNMARKILKSTGVCNNFDADDTVWDTLTVTVTPLQTGVLYLRGYYCKTKEDAKSNIFFCDTVIGVA